MFWSIFFRSYAAWIFTFSYYWKLAQIYEAAVRGLSPVTPPLPVNFPLPDPRDLFSLKPGSLASDSNNSKAVKIEKPPSLNAAIAGARAAATQFSNKDNSPSVIQDGDVPISARTRNKRKEAVEWQDFKLVGASSARISATNVLPNSNASSKANYQQSSFSL